MQFAVARGGGLARDVLEEDEWVVLRRVERLRDGADRARARGDAFLVARPRNVCGVELRGEVRGAARAVRRRRVVVARERVIGEHVRARLHPDVVRLAVERRELVTEARRVRVRFHQRAVDVWRVGGVAVDRRLRAVLHRDDEDDFAAARRDAIRFRRCVRGCRCAIGPTRAVVRRRRAVAGRSSVLGHGCIALIRG